MEESKLIALHDTLTKLGKQQGLGVSSQYSWATNAVIEERKDGLPANALYANFVKEGSYDPSKKNLHGDGRMIKRNFDDTTIPQITTDDDDDSPATKRRRKEEKKAEKKAKKKEEKLAAKKAAKLEEKRRAKKQVKQLLGNQESSISADQGSVANDELGTQVEKKNSKDKKKEEKIVKQASTLSEVSSKSQSSKKDKRKRRRDE